MLSSERGFAHLVLIVALFGLIFIFALFFLQVKAPNSNYQIANPIPSVQSVKASDIESTKVFSNSELGLSFSYLAQTFQARQDTEDEYFKRANGNARKNFAYYVGYNPGEFAGAVDLVNMTNGSLDNAPFLVWVFKNPDNLDAQGWFKRYWYYPFMWGQFEPQEKAKLAPINSISVNGIDASYGEVSYQTGSPKYYYISKDGKMYLIRVLNDDQTIESLKFL